MKLRSLLALVFLIPASNAVAAEAAHLDADLFKDWEQTRPRRQPQTPSEWEYEQKVAPGRYGVKLEAGSEAAEGFVTVRSEPGKTGVR